MIIAGGGVSGIAAAYTAAKNGLKTLIIEKEAFSWWFYNFKPCYSCHENLRTLKISFFR
ncbi:MAG: FAD-dependent oxidoreductase [Candidatus Melainabacteria bacterium]|nr:MAG: FAD-dependent oxidoreductase [Candidatus Melainabacteria bacterium]